jgi:hypothetical protein
MKSPILSPLLLILSATLSSSAAELFVNGNFSSGNTGFGSAYTYSPGNLLPAGTYDVVTDPVLANIYAASFGDHTTGTGLMLAINGGAFANNAAWTATVNVTGGTTYQFSGWVASWGYYYQPIDPSPAVLKIVIDGQQQGANIPVNPANGQWQQMSFQWTAPSSGPVTLAIYDLNTDPEGNDFALDDMSFQNVPEPSSAAYGILLGGIWICRRLKNQTPKS